MQIVIAIGLILFLVVFVGMLIATTRIVYARPPELDEPPCPSCGGRPCSNECNPGASDPAPRIGRWTVPPRKEDNADR